MISLTEVAHSNAEIVCAITGFPAVVANNLLKPVRLLLPAETIIAVNMVARLKG
jgi:hypothetical protein